MREKRSGYQEQLIEIMINEIKSSLVVGKCY